MRGRAVHSASAVEDHIEAGYKGTVIGTKYTANIVVVLDISDQENWVGLRIDYSDNNNLAHNATTLTTCPPS